MTHRIVIRGEYAVAIQPFISTEETRYYLQGFLVERDPVQGVRIVATDGHRMAIFHDATGTIEGERQIVKLPKPALSLLGKRLKGGERFLVVENGTASVHPFGPDAPAEMVFPSAVVDGTFPEYQRVVPMLPAEHAACPASFNAGYAGDFASACLTRDHHVTLIPTDANCQAPMLVRTDRDDFLGVLMPRRGPGASVELPAFWTAIPKQDAKAA